MSYPTLKGLTDQQAKFVRHLLDGLPMGEAAIKAGYSDSSPAYRLVRTPAVIAAIHAHLGAKLRTEAAPAAFNLLLRVIQDEKAPLKLRVDASKTILDRAGHIAPKAAEPDRAGDKPMSEMSAEELRAFVSRAQSELANRARPVIDMDAPAPAGAQPGEQVIDLL